MTIADTDLLVTREGVRLHVRKARLDDEAALAAFFARVTPEDLRFRFLASVGQVGNNRLIAMVGGKDPHTDSLIVFDDDSAVVAVAMLAGDATGESAEAAITVRSDRKGLGIGWTLLDRLLGDARRQGYAVVESIEDRSNREAIEVECQMGFETLAVEDDPMLVRVIRRLR